MFNLENLNADERKLLDNFMQELFTMAILAQ